MKAIILAAGYATRLYPLTKNTPKALLDIKGTTILDHILEKVEKINEINEIVIVSNNKFYSNFLNWKKTYKGKCLVTILNDNTNSNEDRLGAIGDINFAIETKKINEDIIILASDNYFSFELTNLYEYYKEKNSDCITGTYADEELLAQKRFAVAKIDNTDQVIDLEEKPDNPKSNIIAYAIYIYKKETLPLFKEYLNEGNSKDAPGNFPSWLHKKKPIYCYKFTGSCIDIGTVEAYNNINK